MIRDNEIEEMTRLTAYERIKMGKMSKTSIVVGIVTADTGIKILTYLRELSVKLLPSEAERELLVRKDPDMAGRCTQSHGEAVPPQLTNSHDADSDLRCCKRSIPTPESRLKDKLKLYTAKS